jgi:hypothetical protein
MTHTPRLILVYNAKGGLFHMMADAVHKIVSPQTYPCSLCAISYGPVSMHRAWRDTLAALPVETQFYHSDDFPAAYPAAKAGLPAILLAQGAAEPEVLIAASELDQLPSLEALIALLHQRLGEQGITPSSG